MTAPHVEQTRRIARLSTGATAYEITTLVTDRGTLPTRNLFVVKIANPGDAKTDVLARIATPMDVRRLQAAAFVRVDSTSLAFIDDATFARIASLSELTTMAQDRAEAVRLNLTEYLTASVTLTYPDQVQADAAYRQLLARLSKLATDWTTFTAGFETDPTQGYDLPVLPQSVEDERRALYDAARAGRVAAELAVDAAQAAFAACHDGCEGEREIHRMLVEDVAFLERADSRVRALTETGTANAKDFVLRQGSYASDDQSYAALLAAKRARLLTATQAVQACADNCAALEEARDAAQADLGRAADAERQALAAVRDVCPTFVPTE